MSDDERRRLETRVCEGCRYQVYDHVDRARHECPICKGPLQPLRSSVSSGGALSELSQRVSL